MAKREMKTQKTEVNEPQVTMCEEEVIEPVEEVVEKVVTGTVVGCTKLNVRKEAKKDADILGTIPVKDKVTILSDKPVKGLFHKVRTATGLEGYCMKNYIKIEQ